MIHPPLTGLHTALRAVLPSALPRVLRRVLRTAWHAAPRWQRALGCAALLACALPSGYAAPPLPGLTLAQTWHAGMPVQDYWVSEKYDGVRGYWDGQRLLSRQGQPIHAPAWFTAGWPATPLDGELWAGRGQFALAQSAAAQATPDEMAWHRVRYMVFDAPAAPGGFGQRIPAIAQAVAAIGQPWVQAVPQWRVKDVSTLQAQLHQLTGAGAEGLMLRSDSAPYRGGRSDDLVKLKLYDDAEAVVVGHVPGQGRYKGQTGALRVQMPSGQQFKLGTGLSDAQRKAPPPVGSTVTYRYTGVHASGLPRFARFWRVRADEPPAEKSAQN